MPGVLFVTFLIELLVPTSYVFFSILFWICEFICWQVLDGDASLVAIVFDTSTVEPLFSACGYAMSYLTYAF
jgi:hypothetical protein